MTDPRVAIVLRLINAPIQEQDDGSALARSVVRALDARMLSPETIERVARALYAQTASSPGTPPPWDEIADVLRSIHRARARVALAAITEAK